MLRADHWETTTVQELRGHAEHLARHLAAPNTDPSRLRSQATVSEREDLVRDSSATHP
jgi:hypothetical protein